MCLILQGIRVRVRVQVQVQVLKSFKSVQESSEKMMFIKSWQISRQMYLSRFNMWNSTDISTAVYIENYEIQTSKSVFHAYPSYLYRVSFFTTLDIYKNYFKGHQRWCNLIQSDYSLKLWPETICHNSSFSWRSYFVCVPRVL